MFSAFQKFGRLGASASAAPFSPTKLFAAGEAGGVWDFTTLANLYQDSAGTTPCTAVGDPIGLVLDTSGALVSTTYTDYTVDPASWIFLGASYNSGTLFLKEDASNGWHLSYPTNAITSGARGILIAEVKPSTRTWALLNLGGFVYYNLSTLAVGTAVNTYGYGIKSLADGWVEISIAPFITAANGWVANASGDGAGNYAGDNTSGIYVRNVRQNLFRHGKTTPNPSLASSASTITRTVTPKYRGGLLMGDSFAVASATDATKTVNNTSTNLMMCPVGTGGRTLAQINAAFTTDVGSFDPSFAVLQGGINDINLASSDPLATMQAQVSTFITSCYAVNIIPVLTKLPPDKNYSLWSSQRQGWMDAYNAWITTYAETARLPLIDLPGILSTDGQTLSAAYDSGDGLHPNAAGYAAIGAAIVSALDSEILLGNHASQATPTKRPTLGRMPATGVRNLLTYTEDFSNAAWTKSTGTSVSGQIVSFANNNDQIYSQYSPTLISDVVFTPKMSGSGVIGVRVNGVETMVTLTGTPTRYSITGSFSGAGNAVNIGRFGSSTATSITLENTQLELGSTATAYQKVGAAYDVTESGVASVYTAYFDGVDDCLVSPSIDFSGTDAMSVFSGFRKTSDAARGMVAELSATTDSNNGSFALTAPNAASATIVYESKGTSLTDTSATIAAPADSVISAVSDISADSNVLRRNGAQTDSDTGDQGTGNFGNYPIYVGQRGGVSSPYKGFLSALCTRGAATDATTVTSMEKWIAARTPGAVLP